MQRIYFDLRDARVNENIYKNRKKLICGETRTGAALEEENAASGLAGEHIGEGVVDLV